MAKLIKDVMKARTYRPNPGDQSFVVDITPEILDHWSRTFSEMKDRQIGIPVPWEHPPIGDEASDPIEWSSRKTGDPRINAGWVDEVYREGDTLKAVLDIDDKYAPDLARVGCYVSPKFGGSWTDSTGKRWDNPIYHIALTTKPVAIDQSREFKPVATPSLAFSRAMCFSTSQWEAAVPDEMTPDEAIDKLLENPEVQRRVAEKFGKLGIPVQQFADPGMPGMPSGMPDQPAPPPAADPNAQLMHEEPDTDDAVVASLMQFIQEIMQSCSMAMQSVTELMGQRAQPNLPAAPPMTPPPGAGDLTAQPAVMAMSRDDIDKDELINAMAHKLSVVERAQYFSRIDAILDAGKCTAPQAEEMRKQVGQYEFSRQREMPNLLLAERIKMFEELPSFAATGGMSKGVLFSRDGLNASPAAVSDEISDERADEIIQRGIFGLLP